MLSKQPGPNRIKPLSRKCCLAHFLTKQTKQTTSELGNKHPAM